MKQFSYLIALVIIMMMTACSNEQNETAEVDRTIRIRTSIESPLVGTRAVEDAASLHGTRFVEGDACWVDVVYHGTNTTIPSWKCYGVINSAGEMTFGDEIDPAYYPFDGSAIDIISVYPATTIGSKYVAIEDLFNVQTDQSTPEKYRNSDFMWAFGDNNGGGYIAGDIIDLTFHHLLSKIVVKLQGFEGNASDHSVKIKQVQTVTKLLNNGTKDVALGTTPDDKKEIADINMGNYESAGITAIVIPQTISNGSLLFDVTVGSKTYTYTTDSEISFASGHVYTFTLKFNGTNLCNANIEIDAWTGKDSSDHKYEGNLSE